MTSDEGLYRQQPSQGSEPFGPAYQYPYTIRAYMGRPEGLASFHIYPIRYIS